MPVAIGKETFRIKSDAITYCRTILYRDSLDTEIEGEDADFVRAVLNLRKDKLQEIGSRTVVRFVRKKHRRNTPCFFAELSDGSYIDFSFVKVIRAL
ncbi:DUF3223 domain-containing protein [Sinorhizobium fredii]